MQQEAHRLAERLAALPRAQRLTLLQRMAAQGIEPGTLPIVPFGRNEPVPATAAQRGLWMTWRLAPDSASYKMGGTLELGGDLDAKALSAAVADLERRHEVLRTVYRLDSNGDLNQMLTAVQAGLVEEDLRHQPESSAIARAQHHAQQPFDLEQGPVWRCALLRLDERRHWLVIAVHHIAADGWSESVLVQDLAAFYAVHSQGAGPAAVPAPLPIQFADYAIWQNESEQVGNASRQADHWAARLANAPTLALPLDRPRPVRRDEAGARHAFKLDARTTAGLRRLAEGQGATPFMAMLALLKLALAHLSGDADICVGTPIARRDRAETHGLVGYLTNVLVLRTTVDIGSDFDALLGAVRATVLDAHAHADHPFDALVSALKLDRVPGLNPLFQVKCAEQHDTEGLDRFGTLTVAPVAHGGEHAHFDLSFDFTWRQHEVACEFVYPLDILDAATVEGIADLLTHLAQAVCAAPRQALAELLPATVPSQARGEVHGEPVEDFLIRWDRNVAADAGAVAVQCGAARMSRGEFDSRAQALAAELRARGIGAEVRVGVYAPRSIELVLGLLAVLKAGGVYVPLDPALPAERLEFQARDSGLALLLTIAGGAAPAWAAETPVLTLDTSAPATATLPRAPAAVDPRQAAYLIYTSGSTGRPKGVAIERGNLANYVDGVLGRMALPSSAGAMAMVSTVAADLGHTVLFGALAAGRPLHLVPAELAFDPDGFAAYMREHGVEVLKIVPSHLQALLNAGMPADVLPQDLLILGGEATSWTLLARLAELRPSMRVLNHYGPTETTVGVLTQGAATASRRAATLPLGRPLPAADAYVLDADLAPVPRGRAGELYLGGAGLARGYGGRPGQTAERFVASPFDAGARLYRSGDRVRMLDDGSLEFLGRVDDQVKIRGYRVELREVAQALQGCTGVRAAEVIARDGADGRLQLLAYAVPVDGAQLDEAALREALSASLPDYMVPAAIVVMQALPLNANGKVDRKALPDPDTASTRGEHDEPREGTERILAEVWADVLGLERVGRADNFFQLGGDSILSLKVVARARKRGVPIAPRQLFDAADLAALAGLVEAARGGSPVASTQQAAIPVLDASRRRAGVAASHAQARQWFLWQLDPRSSAYHVGGALRLTGQLDELALRDSFAALVARHEALRTVFRADPQGQVLQCVGDPGELEVPTLDLRELPASSREGRARHEIARLLDTPFDLEAGPLLRVALLRMSGNERVLVVAMHHIVSDGWSMQIIVDEFIAIYRSRIEGSVAPLPALPIQYADYAAWHRDWLRQGEQQRQLGYWTERLGRQHPVLQLATDHPRRGDGQLHLAHCTVDLPASLGGALLQRAQAAGVTPFMLMLAAWQALLHRYTGQEDIRVGAPIANRQRAETEGVVGLFVNTQVLRNRVEAQMTLQSLLTQVRETVVGAQSHADLPFEQLVEALQPERRLGTSPLFQVMHNHQREDDRALRQIAGLSIETYPLGETAAQFDLTLHTTERTGGRIEATIAYGRELFEPATIAQLGGHYRAMLQALIEQPQQAVGAVSLLDDGELQRLQAWGVNDAQLDAERPVHRMIAAQARRNPEAIAIVSGEQMLSYTELDTRANRLAHRLIALGVRSEVKVAVVLDRSPELLIGLLGVLKAGGAYVPLDPELPSERLAFMLADSGAACVVTSEAIRAALPDTGVPGVLLDGLEAWPAHDPAVPLHAESLAYAIYTSGSTGRPKSVMVRHCALSHFLLSMRESPGLDVDDVLVSVTASTFDIAALELFLPLLVGARIVLAGRDTVRDGAALAALVEGCAGTALQATPSGWRLLRAGGWPRLPVRRFKGLCGGEALPPDLADELRSVGVELWNMYGPTETTIWSAAAQVGAASPRISGPIAATSLRVLDAQLLPVPAGVPGELHIGGEGLARGYVGRPGLSAERFVADPLGEPGARLYRTGDLVRWNRDGSLEFLGRIDHQVKIRGWRIELGEIEARLIEQAGVEQAVVVARDDGAGARLVAYVVGASGLEIDALKAVLARHLPEYMVPAQIVLLDCLPLNSNGKIDRKALPEPTIDTSTGFEAPQGMREETLASLWTELLGVERVGRGDDFFALGGHSLLATRMVARLRDDFGFALPLRRVFERPVLHDMAVALPARDIAALEPAVAIDRSGPTPLSDAQQRLWFLWRLDPQGSAFNVPIVFDLHGRLDDGALRGAFAWLVERHAVLRTVFGEHDGLGWQRVLPASAPTLRVLAVEERSQAVDAETAAFIREPFDLTRDPMLRIALLRYGTEQHRLVVVLHHIAADGWSLRMLMNEFAECYAALHGQRSPALAPLSIQYVDYAQAQRQRLEGPQLERLQAYWKATLAGIAPLVLPADKAMPAERRHPGGHVSHVFDAQVSAGIAQLAARHGATPFMVLLAAFAIVASERSGQARFHVGTDMANRQGGREVEALVGFFVNQVALPIDCAAPATMAELLEQLRDTVVDASEHQELPFDRLVEAIQSGRRDARAPLFQVKVIHQMDVQMQVALPGLTVEEVALDAKDAELDLIVSFVTGQDRTEMTIKYDREVYDHETMEDLGAAIAEVLQLAIEQTDAAMGALRDRALAARRAASERRAGERDRRLAGMRGALKRRGLPSQA
ncbi:amino acid adenylation domain-containing protein [Roseateles sp. BYS180W]|uniref:Amino acid adenylation domain-containing protein n=1 Tax=Roseateles rivi TaxID=3299028 RepID=A0ABW7FZS2_9BURK